MPRRATQAYEQRHFAIDWEGERVTCPQGRLSQRMFSGMPCRHIASANASITPTLLMRRATFSAKQARLCSSISVRTRSERPSCVRAWTKSKLQTWLRWSGRGYDGAKKLVGRKRVALVDAEGHVLALAVVPANVQDRDTLTALDDGKAHWPSLRLAILDGAFPAERCKDWCHLHGMRHRVVEKAPDQKGFVALERRWLVERTFGWLSHWAGLLRERAGRLDVATGRLACVACLMALNALYNPT